MHVWLVAHPKQLQQWKGDAPTLYDIAGSAHFINKADVGLVVHRDFEGAIEASGGDEGSRGGGGGAQHPLQNDPFACRIIIRKVRATCAGLWRACRSNASFGPRRCASDAVATVSDAGKHGVAGEESGGGARGAGISAL